MCVNLQIFLWICICVYENGQGHEYVVLTRRNNTVLSWVTLHLICKQAPILVCLELPVSTNQASSDPHYSSVSGPAVMLQNHECLAFYVGMKDLGTSPHEYTTNTLLPESCHLKVCVCVSV